MKISFISTGTELLKGSAVNTNLSFFGRQLAANGIPLHLELACGDAPEEIAEALADAVKSTEILLISGGLGPTSDDRTLETVARFFGRELHLDDALAVKVREFWEKLRRGPCPKGQLKQAMLPDGGAAIPNPVGSASGIEFSARYGGAERHLFLVPGPPNEFELMIAAEIVPRLLRLIPERRVTRGFLCAGVGEGIVARMLEKPVTETGAEIAYCANASGTRVFVSSADPATAESADRLAHELIGSAALPTGVLDLTAYAMELLREQKLTLGAAESCSGGLLSSQLVELPGVSQVFAGSVVCYSNAVKNRLLDVPESLLAAHGAVSAEVASAMAKGAAARLGAECAVAITGVAGPDGGTPEKPVGLVYVAALTPRGAEVRELRLRGGRAMIRARAVAQALLLLIQLLNPALK